MATSFWEIALTTEPLQPLAPENTGEAGGVVDFWGIVRGLEAGSPIRGIRYEAHPRMAIPWLERVAAETQEKFPLLAGCVLRHRYGFVAAGEPSLHVRVACAHRAPALEATGWLITRLKEVVPIWKEAVSVADAEPAASPS
ncbi:MAG: molybdenum cofactor biosynthesis protein MoaE [Verrucomicrobia bacterium]|nr:molybdenum cofactor biosynthesis protein MoaE [Verrucomicrobiota bacterium]